MTDPSKPAAILVVDDEESTLRGVQRTLRSKGYQDVIPCSDSRQATKLLAENQVALLLLDLIMPHVPGEEILAQAASTYPDLPVVVITAAYDVSTAVRCMKLGAVDYLLKPVDGDQLLATVHRAMEQSALRYEASRLREQFLSDGLRQPEAFSQIVTGEQHMLRLFAYLEAVSRGSHPVLISGETGTGKELLAQALHKASGRRGPYVAVSVAGLDDNLFSDTLFGHLAGAFTGAAQKRSGMIEKAGEGTLFLDEIGDLSETSQVKLLRLIQEREYYPLGSDTPATLRARIVAATHKDPAELRQDLYYRLRSYHVEVPPLRQRLQDLPALVDHFLEQACQDLDKPKPEVAGELFVRLGDYGFPGNIRELQAMVFDAVARLDDAESLELRLPDHPVLKDHAAETPRVQFPYPMPQIRNIEQAAVDEAMRRVHGNQSAAARMLGISRPTIRRHLRADGEAGSPKTP